MPRGFTCRDQMIDPTQLRPMLRLLQRSNGYISQQVSTGRHADLVTDNVECIPVLGQSEHGLGEVVAASCVDPTGAEDQVFAA
ncbi:hypothetical protein D3C77_530040 [compost metagenome]